MSLLDDLRKKLDPDTFASVTDQLGDDFNYDVVPRSRLNTVIRQRDTYKAQVDAGTQPSVEDPTTTTTEGNPNNPGKAGGGNPTVNVEELTRKFEQEKAQAIQDLRVEFAGLNMLRDAGAFDPQLAWTLIDKSKLTLNADGSLAGMDEQITSQKEARAFMYGEASARRDGERGTGKNGGGSGTTTVTKADFLKMSYDEQVRFKETYPETFKEFLNS